MNYLVIPLTVALVLSGCVPSNFAQVVDSANKDKAARYGSVDTVYGKGKGCQWIPEGIPGSTVEYKCDQDGMKFTITTPNK